eukprot:1151144-Pelagomonas_calceolata.AAC.2
MSPILHGTLGTELRSIQPSEHAMFPKKAWQLLPQKPVQHLPYICLLQDQRFFGSQDPLQHSSRTPGLLDNDCAKHEE